MKTRAFIAPLVFTVLLWNPTQALAGCDGCVVNAVQSASNALTSAIQTGIASLLKLLNEIDTNLAGTSSKISDSVVQASHMQREMAVEVQRQAERERVARETELPIDPCAASGSNYAASAVRHAQGTASGYRRGGVPARSRALNQALNQAVPSIDASQQMTTTIHQSNYCSALESNLGYCAASRLPDGDADVGSLFTGAGPPDKPADLTFTPEQIDAARAYARLALDPTPPQHITRAQAHTEAGRRYLAEQKAYQASISSSEKAIFDEIASHTPFPGSAKLIQALKQSDAAARYFDATASDVAQRTGQMSWAELVDFEVGRRWRNPYWIVEMAAQADPVQIAREQLFTTALIAELQYQNLQKSKHTEILLGQILAVLTRAIHQPHIEAQKAHVRTGNAP